MKELVSVAMCTYNGAKHIREQLTSIINQSREVDEIIICDDGSTDNTIPIIKSISTDTTIPILLYENEHNLGVVRNFSRAISMCKGDIVFLSDQDDCWRNNKVEKMVEAFFQHPEAELISSDAEIVDDNGKVYGSDSLWKYVHLDMYDEYKRCDLLPEYVSVTNRVTGATLAFRNVSPYNEFLKYQGNFGFHDETLFFLAISSGHYYPLNEILMSYRLSKGQQCGLNRMYFDRDIHIPFKYALCFNSLPLYSIWKDRFHFIQSRLCFSRRPWRILLNWRKYSSLYGRYAADFRNADICRFIYGVLHYLHIVPKGYEGKPFSIERDCH